MSIATTAPRQRPPTAAPTARFARAGRVGTAVLVAACVLPRLHSSSALWLDEALSVDIARLSLPDLLAWLGHDGSPPLYYLLLHAWMAVLGSGDDAVRALSTLFSLLALPVAYLVGRRLGGPVAARMSLLAVAADPFAIRYATETRMYSLVMLLALLGIWVVLRAWESPTLPRLGAVTLVVGLLMLTHYWTFFFIAAGELVLVLRASRDRWRGPGVRVAVAAPLGGVLFLPWLPSFLYQSAHTGTPWRTAPSWSDLPIALARWGGPGVLGDVYGVAVLLIAAWALRSAAGRRLWLLGVGGLALGMAVCRVQGAAFALRYSAPMAVPVLVAAGLAMSDMPPRWRRTAGALVGVGGLVVVGFSPLLGERTDAVSVAAAIAPGVRSGDLVVYCPDQLGPAVARLLPATVDQVVYPTLAGPALVDWVDYAARNDAASPRAIAARVLARTSGRVWLVRADGYLTYADQCAQLDRSLAEVTGSRTEVLSPGPTRDGAYVVTFAAP